MRWKRVSSSGSSTWRKWELRSKKLSRNGSRSWTKSLSMIARSTWRGRRESEWNSKLKSSAAKANSLAVKMHSDSSRSEHVTISRTLNKQKQATCQANQRQLIKLWFLSTSPSSSQWWKRMRSWTYLKSRKDTRARLSLRSTLKTWEPQLMTVTLLTLERP